LASGSTAENLIDVQAVAKCSVVRRRVAGTVVALELTNGDVATPLRQ
jgi:hypothetical protein